METQTGASRIGQFGAGLLIAIAVVCVSFGATLEGGAYTSGGWAQAGLVLLAAWPVGAGVIALARPSRATYVAAAVVAAAYGVVLIGAGIALRPPDLLFQVGLPLIAGGSLCSAYLLVSVLGDVSAFTRRKEAAFRAAAPMGPGMNARGQALAGHKCASCNRPLSPVWVGQCHHCGAKYAEFPPTPRIR
jgi:hypothetical protein